MVVASCARWLMISTVVNRPPIDVNSLGLCAAAKQCAWKIQEEKSSDLDSLSSADALLSPSALN